MVRANGANAMQCRALSRPNVWRRMPLTLETVATLASMLVSARTTMGCCARSGLHRLARHGRTLATLGRGMVAPIRQRGLVGAGDSPAETNASARAKRHADSIPVMRMIFPFNWHGNMPYPIQGNRRNVAPPTKRNQRTTPLSAIDATPIQDNRQLYPRQSTPNPRESYDGLSRH